jgi:nicotinamide phosphoribosyltransferase
MNKLNNSVIYKLDVYKIGHINMYPSNTQVVYSNFTVRSFEYINKLLGREVDEYLVFGLTAALKEFHKDWNDFFNLSEEEFKKLYNDYCFTMQKCINDPKFEAKHLIELYNYGKLPLHFRHIEDGVVVKGNKIPFMTIYNTHPQFYWLTNYIETDLSNRIWKSITVATIAYHNKKLCQYYSKKTSDEDWFVNFQCHDFSMRGLTSYEDALKTGAAHLSCFVGSDNVPGALYLEENYTNEIDKNYLYFSSVNAGEHSCTSSNIIHISENKNISKRDAEVLYLKRLLTETYQTGTLSYIADTFDFYGLVMSILPEIKQIIMNRNGKLVIRGDSGDPVKILCGDELSDDIYEQKGLIELLGDIFGYTINSKGYKQLDSHIGAIYGDAITPQRLKDILEKLESKGYASSNVVLGIGSYTYQGNLTRDSLGIASKVTYTVVNNQENIIYKDPKTDNGTKKSARGLLFVTKDSTTGIYTLYDNMLKEDYRVMKANKVNELKIYLPEINYNIKNIRNNINEQINFYLNAKGSY